MTFYVSNPDNPRQLDSGDGRPRRIKARWRPFVFGKALNHRRCGNGTVCTRYNSQTHCDHVMNDFRHSAK
jgi:hypothetical protein